MQVQVHAANAMPVLLCADLSGEWTMQSGFRMTLLTTRMVWEQALGHLLHGVRAGK